MNLGSAAIRQARAAARSGRTALADEAERAIDSLLAGPLPEAVARSIVRHRVLQRMVDEVLAAPEGEPAPLDVAVQRILASPTTEASIARVVESPAFRNAMLEVLSSPEIRKALARQSAGFGGELADAIGTRAAALDDSIGRRAEPAPQYGGLVSRAVGLVVDVLLAQLVFVVAAASAALVVSLVGNLGPADDVVRALSGGGWLLVVAAYFVGFWSATGQTPGMRLVRLRVATGDGGRLGFWRSLVRFAGLLLAIVPLFLGFLPVLFDRRRRALQDYLAGTVVVHDRPD
jgi:uncharacterized RDD family membrane protein YckC